MLHGGGGSTAASGASGLRPQPPSAPRPATRAPRGMEAMGDTTPEADEDVAEEAAHGSDTWGTSSRLTTPEQSTGTGGLHLSPRQSASSASGDQGDTPNGRRECDYWKLIPEFKSDERSRARWPKTQGAAWLVASAVGGVLACLLV
mmetsp:Transcript_5927/g.14670  ORF Transcript_5927/g.14670 Transcript_5927/m.14670 type:complete len:146 (-) Transcript_5927:159-596(-)